MSKQLPVIQDLAQPLTTGPVPCTFVPIGTPRYTFFAELVRSGIQGDMADLEGEVTVLAKVTPKDRQGQT